MFGLVRCDHSSFISCAALTGGSAPSAPGATDGTQDLPGGQRAADVSAQGRGGGVPPADDGKVCRGREIGTDDCTEEKDEAIRLVQGLIYSFGEEGMQLP